MIYYNEFDPKAAEWLHWLMGIGVIPQGDVDERSINEVTPADLKGYTQCHFFAGIGGWPLALQIAGIPTTRKLWTGSCPCQPFSAAGSRKGEKDERHLWPVFERLIAECCPPSVYGEQVASADGRKWLAGVRIDLEALGYAVGAADYCAAGVGSPNIRQRLWWVAYSHSGERWRNSGRLLKEEAARAGWRPDEQDYGSPIILPSPAIRLADAQSKGSPRRRERGILTQLGESCETNGLGDAKSIGLPRRTDNRYQWWGQCPSGQTGEVSGLGDAYEPGSQGWEFDVGEYADQWTPWQASDFIGCTDGKARRIEPGSFPLADGVSGRVGLLRGYGNAINPFAAARFIKASEYGREFL